MTALSRQQLARRAFNMAPEPEAEPAPKELRAADCKTPEDWARWARERREYEDPYGYERGRRG